MLKNISINKKNKNINIFPIFQRKNTLNSQLVPDAKIFFINLKKNIMKIIKSIIISSLLQPTVTI